MATAGRSKKKESPVAEFRRKLEEWRAGVQATRRKHAVETAIIAAHETRVGAGSAVVTSGSSCTDDLMFLLRQFSPKISEKQYRLAVVALGESLYDLGEYTAASELCFRHVESCAAPYGRRRSQTADSLAEEHGSGAAGAAGGPASPVKALKLPRAETPGGGSDSALRAAAAAAARMMRRGSPEDVAVQCRAAYGRALCAAALARERDTEVSSPTTVDQLIECLSKLQVTMQQVLDRAEDFREALYWVVYNGTVHIYSIAEPLITLGYPGKVVNYLNWCILAMEALPQLLTPKYLPWRVRIYSTICLAYEDAGNTGAAFKAAERGLSRIEQLRREQAMDPPIPDDIATMLRTCRHDLSDMRMKYAATLQDPAPIVEGVGKTYDDDEPRAVAALVRNLRSSKTRVLRHAPVAERDRERVEAVVAALNTRLEPFRTTLVEAIHDNAVADWEGSEEARLLPAKLHQDLVRALYNLELNSELQLYLLPLIARLTPAVQAAEEADRTRYDPYNMTSAEENPLATTVIRADGFGDMGFTVGASEAASEAGSTARRGSVDLGISVAEARRLRHEAMMLRAFYEMEHGPMPPIPRPAGETMGDTEGNMDGEGGDDDAGSKASEAGDAVAGFDMPAGTAAAAGKPPRVDSPVEGIEVEPLEAVAQVLLEAVDRHRASLAISRADLLADGALELWRRARTLLAWLDARDVTDVTAPQTKARVRLLAVTCLRAVHGVATVVNVDDALMRGTCALRLGRLLGEIDERREAVQVLRRGLIDIQRARDQSVRADVHQPARADDAMAMAYQAASCFFDRASANELQRRAGAGAYGGSGVYGAGSQIWSLDQALGFVHADIIAALFAAELELSVELNARYVARRQQLRDAARAAKAHAAPPPPPSAKAATGGAGAAAAAAAAAEPDSGDAPRSLHGLKPAAAVEHRLLVECGQNSTWKAILYLSMLKYRTDPVERGTLLQDAARALAAADKETQQLLDRVAELDDGTGVGVQSKDLQEAGRRGSQLGTRRGSQLASQRSDLVSEAAGADAGGAALGTARAASTARAPPSAPAATAAPPAPQFLSRGSTFIALRLQRFVQPGQQAELAAGGALASQRSMPLTRKRGPKPKSVSHYVLYGKPTGAGTAVALTNTDVGGTGERLTLAAHKPNANALQVASEERYAAGIVAEGRALTPNESYVFAVGAYEVQKEGPAADVSHGKIIGGIGATSLPVLAASPLPTSQVWGALADAASRLGYSKLAGRAAGVVVRRWVDVGPHRAPWLRSPLHTIALVREEVARTPRPLIYSLVRALFVLSETLDGDAAGPGSGGFQALTDKSTASGTAEGSAVVAAAAKARIGEPAMLVEALPEAEEGGDDIGEGGVELSEEDKEDRAKMQGVIPDDVAALPKAKVATNEEVFARARRDADATVYDVGQTAGEGGLVRSDYEDAALAQQAAPVRAHAAAVRRVKTMMMACEAASVLRDPALLMQAACGLYTHALPLLAWKHRGPLLLQALVTAHQAFQLVRPEVWTTPAAATYGRLVYEISTAGVHAGELSLARASLLKLGPGSGPLPAEYVQHERRRLNLAAMQQADGDGDDDEEKVRERQALAAAVALNGGRGPYPLSGPWAAETMFPPHLTAFVRDPLRAATAASKGGRQRSHSRGGKGVRIGGEESTDNMKKKAPPKGAAALDEMVARVARVSTVERVSAVEFLLSLSEWCAVAQGDGNGDVLTRLAGLLNAPEPGSKGGEGGDADGEGGDGDEDQHVTSRKVWQAIHDGAEEALSMVRDGYGQHAQFAELVCRVCGVVLAADGPARVASSGAPGGGGSGVGSARRVAEWLAELAPRLEAAVDKDDFVQRVVTVDQCDELDFLRFDDYGGALTRRALKTAGSLDHLGSRQHLVASAIALPAMHRGARVSTALGPSQLGGGGRDDRPGNAEGGKRVEVAAAKAAGGAPPQDFAVAQLPEGFVFDLPEEDISATWTIFRESHNASLKKRTLLLWLAQARQLQAQALLEQLVALGERRRLRLRGRGPRHDLTYALSDAPLIPVVPTDADELFGEGAVVTETNSRAAAAAARAAAGGDGASQAGDGASQADDGASQAAGGGDGEGKGDDGASGAGAVPDPVPGPNDVAGLIRAALDAAAQAAVRARGAEAWGVCRNAARTSWSTLWAGWVSPEQFGVIEPPPRSDFDATGGSGSGSPSRRQSVTFVDGGAARPGSGDEEKKGAPDGGDGGGDARSADLGGESVPELDWRPVWRTAMALLDLFDAIGREDIERTWGSGWKAREEEAAGKLDRQLIEDGFSEEPDEDGTESFEDSEFVDDEEEEEAVQGALPAGVNADDLVWMAQYVQYACQCLSRAREFMLLCGVGDRFQTVFPMHLVTEAQRRADADRAHVPAPAPPAPGSPDAPILPQGQLPPPADVVTMETLAARREQLERTVGPVGVAAAEEAVAGALPLMVHAARQLAQHTASLQAHAERVLREFEEERARVVAARDAKRKKRKKATIVEQQKALGAEERLYLQQRGRLGAVVGAHSIEATARRIRLQGFEARLGAYRRDMSVTRQALEGSRVLLAAYLHEAEHGTPVGGAEGVLPPTAGVSGRVSVDAVVQHYGRTIALLRRKQEWQLLAEALHELGLVQLSTGGEGARRAAVESWNDALDASFGAIDVAQNWRDVLRGLEPDPLSAVGVRGCLLPALLLGRLYRHRAAASGDLDTGLEYLRFAAALFRCLFNGSLEHPQRAADFGRYRARHVAPAVDVLADEARLPVTAVLSAARDTAAALLAYGDAGVEQVLPIVAFYEHVAADRLRAVDRTVDARLLRAEALTRVGDIAGACAALASVLRGDDLPHLGGVRGGRSGDGDGEGDDEADGDGGAAATYSEPIPDGIGDVDGLTREPLAEFQNHLPPEAPQNRAALKWVADASLALPPAVAAVCGRELVARVALVRASLLLHVGGDAFAAVPPPGAEEYAANDGGAVGDAAGAGDDGGAEGAAWPDAGADGGWGGEGGAALARSLVDAADAMVSALAATLAPDVPEPPAEDGEGDGDGDDGAAAAREAQQELADPQSRAVQDLRVACLSLRARVLAWRGMHRGAARVLAAAMSVFSGSADAYAAHDADADSALPDAVDTTSDAAARRSAAEAAALRARDDGAASGEGEADFGAADAEWAGRRTLGLELGMVHWLSLRNDLARQLVACGCLDAATEQLDVALREARAARGAVVGRRLLVSRAELATLAGDLSTARTALRVVYNSAGDGWTEAQARAAYWSKPTPPGPVLADVFDSVTVAAALLARAELDTRTRAASAFESQGGGDGSGALASAADALAGRRASVRALRQAQGILETRLDALGWRAFAVDRFEPPAAQLDSMYHPHTAALADVRSRLADAMAEVAELRAARATEAARDAVAAARDGGGDDEEGAAQLPEGAEVDDGADTDIEADAAPASGGGARGVPAYDAWLLKQRLRALTKLEQAHSTLRHAVHPDPSVRARILIGLGRLRRQTLAAHFREGAAQLQPPRKSGDTELPATHPFSLAVAPLRAALAVARDDCANDRPLLRRALTELVLLYGARVVRKLEARHTQVAAHYMRLAGAVCDQQVQVERNAEALAAESAAAAVDDAPDFVRSELQADARAAAARLRVAVAAAKEVPLAENEARADATAEQVTEAEAGAVTSVAALRLLLQLQRDARIFDNAVLYGAGVAASAAGLSHSRRSFAASRDLHAWLRTAVASYSAKCCLADGAALDAPDGDPSIPAGLLSVQWLVDEESHAPSTRDGGARSQDGADAGTRETKGDDEGKEEAKDGDAAELSAEERTAVRGSLSMVYLLGVVDGDERFAEPVLQKLYVRAAPIVALHRRFLAARHALAAADLLAAGDVPADAEAKAARARADFSAAVLLARRLLRPPPRTGTALLDALAAGEDTEALAQAGVPAATGGKDDTLEPTAENAAALARVFAGEGGTEQSDATLTQWLRDVLEPEVV